MKILSLFCMIFILFSCNSSESTKTELSEQPAPTKPIERNEDEEILKKCFYSQYEELLKRDIPLVVSSITAASEGDDFVLGVESGAIINKWPQELIDKMHNDNELQKLHSIKSGHLMIDDFIYSLCK